MDQRQNIRAPRVSGSLSELSRAAEQNQLIELSALVSDCETYLKRDPLPGDARDLVRETLAVVPQMLHAEPGVVESVRGLSALRQRLSHTDDDPLDNTLQTVFVRECATHIATLRKAISVARADIPLSKLPSENMLRALHTLSGCTQTVDATDIVAIVNPLQKSALRLQRAGISFTDSETDYIERLADAMEARLESFKLTLMWMIPLLLLNRSCLNLVRESWQGCSPNRRAQALQIL